MRFCLLFAVLVLTMATVAYAAPYGPLAAGTAPGPMSIASPDYAIGVHYPFSPSCDVISYGDLNGSRLVNGTLPYEEWPDRAMVPGKRAIMSADIVILSSTRKK